MSEKKPSDEQSPSKDMLTEARQAAHDLANDPPNGITTLRALTALERSVAEIERLTRELADADARGERKARAAARQVAELNAAQTTDCTVGVGDGSGNLFVHGSYEAVKRVQSMILELERLRAPGLGDEVTYTPTYGGTGLPREGWKVEVLPRPTYVIKHPSGTVIAVLAEEIRAEKSSTSLGQGADATTARDSSLETLKGQ